MIEQEKTVKKKWNEEKDLERWERFYHQNDHHGNKLKSRESVLLGFFKALKLRKGSKVLELGYGAGITSAKILGMGFNITGVDISRPLQKIAQEKCDKVKSKYKANMMIGNVENLEFSDNSFDCVIGLGFMQYLDYPDKCLKEVYRVLKPKGYFIIAQTNMYGISKIDSFLKLARAIVYLITQKRYEIRYTDKPFIYFIEFFSELFYFIPSMKRLSRYLKQQKRIGFVKRNLISLPRLKKEIRRAKLKVLKQAGAGYLSKKSKYFPTAARKLDKYLQNLSDSKNSSVVHNFGNSVVVLAKK